MAIHTRPPLVGAVAAKSNKSFSINKKLCCNNKRGMPKTDFFSKGYRGSRDREEIKQ